MLLSVVVYTIAAVAVSNAQNCGWRKLEYGPNGGGYVDGFVAHGMNNFNGDPVVDFTDFGGLFNMPMWGQYALNENGPMEIRPDASTDRSLQLAMGRFLSELVPDITPDESLYNQPYYDVGTITVTSTNIDERTVPTAFAEIASDPSTAFANGDVYFPPSVNPNPTLGEWEMGSGRIEIDCHDGRATVKVRVCNMMPEALYTLWDVGISHPGGAEEPYVFAAGGVGNVLRTDEHGNGRLKVYMPWCPSRECVPGVSVDCQLVFSLLHHSDYMSYGAESAPAFFKPYGYPDGIAGTGHLIFYLHGSPLQDPLNKYDRKQCRKMHRK
eukprot:CAMPEP_0197031210 /NCGR_PEP_ID=MMETSP1384-20130603/10280_1 /TAXON_ID=29189 /ORGANISM="Ammonia sp." /LENGTH=324 /DNA_ID=CAMNT_0042460707 /DNA_START=45 /DNA_END=1019 /DNA_ORIENTATION=-